MHLYVIPRVAPAAAPESTGRRRRELADTLPEIQPSEVSEFDDTLPRLDMPARYDDFFEAPTVPGVALGPGASSDGDLSLDELLARQKPTLGRLFSAFTERLKRALAAHFESNHQAIVHHPPR